MLIVQKSARQNPGAGSLLCCRSGCFPDCSAQWFEPQHRELIPQSNSGTHSRTLRTRISVIRGKVTYDSVIYSDGLKSYDGLVDVGYDKHFRIDHGNNEFARGHNHINDIEGFWGVAKTRLAKFRGMSKNTFYLHLKECEFRYNYRNQNLYLNILKIVRTRPLF